MQKLTPNDLHFVLSRTPADVRKLLREDPTLFLAGGFIRAVIKGEQANDIDVFGPSKPHLQAAAVRFALGRQGRVHSTENADTVLHSTKIPVQFIHRWTFTDRAALLDSFDFTICQAAVFVDKDGKFDSAIAPTFYADLAASRLTYTSPVRDEAPGGSLMRVIKYVRRGYNIQASSLGAVVSRLFGGLRGAAAETQAVKGEHYEKWRTRVIVGLLREVDPRVVIDGLDPIEPEPAT